MRIGKSGPYHPQTFTLIVHVADEFPGVEFNALVVLSQVDTSNFYLNVLVVTLYHCPIACTIEVKYCS